MWLHDSRHGVDLGSRVKISTPVAEKSEEGTRSSRRSTCERATGSALRQDWRRKQAPQPALEHLVFVAIAAYEDLELENTLRSLLHAAAHPERIVIGIVWQGKTSCPALAPDKLATYGALMKADAGSQGVGDLIRPSSASHRALETLGFTPEHHLNGRIRALQLSASEARGPCWARYLSELLWHGEGWYSQLDSHMRLARAWDTECIREIKLLERSYPKPLLTCYGVGFERGAPYDWGETTAPAPPLVMAASHFDEDGVLQTKGSAARSVFATPRLNYFFSANFSFSRGARVAEVAYDPRLKYIFYGEEILFAVRLFTAGWDVFTPSRAWAFHLWEKSHRPSYDAGLGPDEKRTLEDARARLHALLAQRDGPRKPPAGATDARSWPRPNGLAPVGSDDAVFTLGSERTVAAYEAAACVRFGTREIDDVARYGFVRKDELLRHDDIDDLDEKLASLEVKHQPAVWELAPSSTEADEGATIADRLETRERGHPKVRVIADALPAALADEARALLSSLPKESWEVADTRGQPLMDGAKRVPMHYRRNPKGRDPAAIAALRERVRDSLLPQLKPRPFERLLINFSRYDAGDFLDSHEDTPSGSRCYERRVAFVWHLSRGWGKDDGGLFVDEAARCDEQTHYTPTFNSLVSFAVPRMHKVTKVTKPGEPRFAVYGWIATPEVTYVEGTKQLRNELYALQNEDGANESPRAAAMLIMPDPPPKKATVTLHRFASLPMDEIGLGHCTGDFCRFFIGSAGKVSLAQTFNMAADKKRAHDDDFALAVLRPDGNPTEVVVTRDETVLCDAAALASFIHRERKVWHSPCPMLDLRNGLGMADMYFSPEVKIHVFCTFAGRSSEFMDQLEAWASALRPQLRFFLCEPGLCEPVMESYGLAPRDAPTVVADDTQGTHSKGVPTKYRMRDQFPPPRAKASNKSDHFDLSTLRQFVALIAARAHVDKDVVMRLRST